jgi:hypothetical protein
MRMLFERRNRMEKPRMKRSVAVTNEMERQGIIYFYANETIAARL